MIHFQPDPLKTHSTQFQRRSFMISLIVLFFILSPGVILYTAGFRFNFQTRTIESTGVLSIDVQPDNADVFINDIQITDSIPIWLTSLAPGTYRVRISKPGFHTLNKDFSVHSGETTYVKDITLFKANSPQKIVLLENSATKLWLSDPTVPIVHGYYNQSSTQFMFTVSGANYSEVPLAHDTDFSCSPLKQHCATLIKNDSTLSVIDTVTPNNPYTIKLNPGANQLQWNHLRTGPLLYVGTNKEISQLNPDYSLAQIVAPINASLWFVADNQSVWTYVSGTIHNLADSTEDFGFSTNGSLEKIITINKNFALLKIDTGVLLIKNPGKKNQEEKNIPAMQWEYHLPTKEWRLVSPWEIISVYPNGDSAVLYRSDEPIKAIYSLEKTGVFLIIANNKLIGFNPGYYVSQELARFDAVDAVDTDEDGRAIAIAGTWQGERGIFTISY